MHSHNNAYMNPKNGGYDNEEDSSESNGNDQWTPDQDKEGRDEYTKEYSSDPDEMKLKKKRIRKKGRKAKFLVELMLQDQQEQVNRQIMIQYEQQAVPQTFDRQPANQYSEPNYSHKPLHPLPELETVGANHIPGVIDIVPRGNH